MLTIVDPVISPVRSVFVHARECHRKACYVMLCEESSRMSVVTAGLVCKCSYHILSPSTLHVTNVLCHSRRIHNVCQGFECIRKSEHVADSSSAICADESCRCDSRFHK